MGANQSVLKEKGYTIQTTTEDGVIAASKQGDLYFIKSVNISKLSKSTAKGLSSYCETLKNTDHPNIVRHKEFVKDDNTYYFVSDHCNGGNLAEKIKQMKMSGQRFNEDQILQWIVQICMALKYIHGQGLLYKDLSPQRLYLTEFETIRLGEFKNLRTDTKPNNLATVNKMYLSPENLFERIYHEKSDIWSLSCILYELCTLTCAFTDEKTDISKINLGPCPTLPERFTPELQTLLKDMFQRDPSSRPTASDILKRQFIISFLMRQCKITTGKLPENLKKLRDLADDLESMHKGTTIGSLTGGVIGAAGGITSIVGLILAPFTLGASLIVTGVGIGVAVAGGAAAGASNITNMVKQSGGRQAVRRIIKEFEEKVSSVVSMLKVIGNTLEELQQNTTEFENGDSSREKLTKLGVRVGRGVGGISELTRLIQVVNIGRVAAQTARVVRVAEVLTGVFSALFVAVDVFFIAMDARELHRISEAKELEGDGSRTERSGSRLEMLETDSDSDSEPAEPQADPKMEKVKSETMKFVITIRQNVQVLQKVVDELSQVTSQLG